MLSTSLIIIITINCYITCFPVDFLCFAIMSHIILHLNIHTLPITIGINNYCCKRMVALPDGLIQRRGNIVHTRTTLHPMPILEL